MVGRTPKAAIQPFRDSLQRAIACVSQAHVVVLTPRFSLRPELALIGRDRALSLSMDVFYEIVPVTTGARGRRAATTGYRYTLGDGEGREFVSYQWDQRGRSPVTTPHLHLGSRLVRPGVPFGGVHRPTGKVTLADVLRVVFVEFGVEPQRPDWEAVLRRLRASLRGSKRHPQWRAWTPFGSGKRRLKALPSTL